MKTESIIINISQLENISPDSFKSFIKSFEKFIKSEVKKYDDKSGLEDIKLNKNDYKILYELHKNTAQSAYKVHILLLYMYSFYKLDGICFNPDYFPMKLFFNFLKDNENIHKLILDMIGNLE